MSLSLVKVTFVVLSETQEPLSPIALQKPFFKEALLPFARGSEQATSACYLIVLEFSNIKVSVLKSQFALPVFSPALKLSTVFLATRVRFCPMSRPHIILEHALIYDATPRNLSSVTMLFTLMVNAFKSGAIH